MISASRRETSFPGTTTSHPASRPNTSEVPAMAYSRPSVRQTTRPPVLPVGFPAPLLISAFTAAAACWKLTACTYCVLPERRSSTNVSSRPPTSTLSPCSRGVASPPSRTPLINTSAAATALRITTWPSASPWRMACVGRMPSPVRLIGQAASLPRSTSPAGMVNFFAPHSSKAISLPLAGRAGNYARLCNRARKHGLRRDRLFLSNQPAAQPIPEQHRADDHGRIAVDEAPDEDVARRLLRRDVNRHHRRREQFREPRSAGRGRKIQQEGDQGLQH